MLFRKIHARQFEEESGDACARPSGIDAAHLLPLIETASDTKKIVQRMAMECKKAWEKKDLYTPDRLLTSDAAGDSKSPSL